MEKKRAYNKISDKKKEEPSEKDILEKTEPAPIEEKPEDDHKKLVEAKAFEFIAGKLGSTSDQAAKAISAAGLDPDEVIGVGLRILKGEYFGKEN